MNCPQSLVFQIRRNRHIHCAVNMGVSRIRAPGTHVIFAVVFAFSLAAGEGFEPPLTDSKSAVLPLDDPATTWRKRWDSNPRDPLIRGPTVFKTAAIDRSATLPILAEGEGFEPPDPFGSPAFETGAISRTLPSFQLGAGIFSSRKTGGCGEIRTRGTPLKGSAAFPRQCLRPLGHASNFGSPARIRTSTSRFRVGRPTIRRTEKNSHFSSAFPRPAHPFTPSGADGGSGGIRTRGTREGPTT